MDITPRLDSYHFYEQEWESYEQLCDWFEWEIPETFNMATYVCDRWATDPDRVALFYEHESGDRATYTFAQVQRAANQLANYLRAHGIERGDRIGVNTPQKPETAIAHIAAWKLGAVSIPLSTLYGPDALTYRLGDAEAKAIIVDESNVDTVDSIAESIEPLETVLTVDHTDPSPEMTDFWEALDGVSEQFDTVETDPNDNALIMYTSGTTGAPKGVLHAHRLLLGHLPGNVAWLFDFDVRESDVLWIPAEWAWMASLFPILFNGLYFGRPVVAYQGGSFDPENAFRLIEAYDISVSFIPPTALRMMMQVDAPANRWELDSMRVVGSGGEALGQSVATWAADVFSGATVAEGYGQTEANLMSLEVPSLFDSPEGTFGMAPPGRETAIVDPETTEPLSEPDAVGEFAVRYEGDPICMKAYWNKPEKTDAVRTNGWQLTGDLGSRDENGRFGFVGRKDDVIISSGYRIGPEEIEDSLLTHDAVADVGVVGIPDEQRGSVPKAYVVLADGVERTPELVADLQSYVKDRLAKYEYPREIEFIDELPMTATGKIQRAKLRERSE